MSGKQGSAHSGYLGSMPPLDLPAWMADGVCATSGADPDFWFPDRDDGAAERAAVVACLECPVRMPCLERALSLRELRWGVFGGMSPRQRQALARKKAA